MFGFKVQGFRVCGFLGFWGVSGLGLRLVMSHVADTSSRSVPGCQRSWAEFSGTPLCCLKGPCAQIVNTLA